MQEEQEQLLQHVRTVVPDTLLLELLVRWLQPSPAGAVATIQELTGQAAASSHGHDGTSMDDGTMPGAPLLQLQGTWSLEPSTAIESPARSSCDSPCSPDFTQLPPAVQSTPAHISAVAEAINNSIDAAPVMGTLRLLAGRKPLQSITHLHRSICSAMDIFLREARAMLVQHGSGGCDITMAQLSSLMERQRFLR